LQKPHELATSNLLAFRNNMIGQSHAFARITQLIEKIARCDAPVLIEGETGTVKELVARAIHDSGAWGGCPFIPVN
jgi:two-component system, NtrC family, response regulator GlrR